MKYKNNLYYQKKQEVFFDFSGEQISTDGAIVLCKKIEKKNNIIKPFADIIKDKRDPNLTKYSIYKLITQRTFLMVQGYQDCNDVKHLANDPIIQSVLEGEPASQPTMSRLENSISIKDIWKMSELMVEKYIDSISCDRKEIIIDVDGTDDPTYGDQQYTLFNGYYGQYMYNILLFHDGETGQLILPVLRPGNCHSNKWFVPVLKRIVQRIKAKRSDLKIIIRGDCGFSGAEFYKLANSDGFNLEFCIGITTNERLKQYTDLLQAHITEEYLSKKIKYQDFTEGFSYRADSWEKAETCYAKVESTGKGMNVRYFCSNMKAESAKVLYKDFYVKRGDASENRIKELKNMCYCDRLSCHKYTANYFRLMLSSLCYEFYRQIKILISKSSNEEAKKWQIDNIRLYLMKVGATIEKKVKTILIKFSKSYICKDLFIELVKLCC